MGCLADKLGIRGCHYDTAPLVFLDDLPGITVKSVEMISPEDMPSFVQMADSIFAEAARTLELDFISTVPLTVTKYNLTCIGRLQTPLVFVPAQVTPEYAGVMFTFSQSQFLDIYVESILFRADVDKDVTFYVVDLATGDQLDTFTATLKAGENRIPVQRSYAPRRNLNQLAIVYDLSTTGYYQTSLNPCYDGCAFYGSCLTALPCLGSGGIQGYSAQNTATGTFGMGVEYEPICSFERFICNNINKFKTALLYAGGVAYCDELLNSPRLNKYTTTNIENLQELKNNFAAKYAVAIEVAAKSINLCDNCCYICRDAQVRTIYMRP